MWSLWLHFNHTWAILGIEYGYRFTKESSWAYSQSWCPKSKIGLSIHQASLKSKLLSAHKIIIQKIQSQPPFAKQVSSQITSFWTHVQKSTEHKIKKLRHTLQSCSSNRALHKDSTYPCTWCCIMPTIVHLHGCWVLFCLFAYFWSILPCKFVMVVTFGTLIQWPWRSKLRAGGWNFLVHTDNY